MAIYHLSLKAIQRSKGRSATASSAYRSRAKITDNRTGLTYDYTRKKGVEGRAIFTPDGSKISREELWNLAEAAERRKDGITAREYEIALPSELDKDQRRELTAEFCRMLVSRYEVAADAAIHAPTPEGDQRNFHAHVQITTRTLKNGVLGAKSEFELSGTDRKKRGLRSQKEELQDIRQAWERMVNASLERAGCPERVSCKSLADQGISRPPTVHLGVAATALERKGVETERGDLNRWPLVRRLYTELREMKKNLRAMEADLARMREKEGVNSGRRDVEEALRPDENDGITPRHNTARVEKPRAKAGDLRERPGRGVGGVGEYSRDTGQIFSERASTGLSSGAGRVGETFSSGGGTGEDLGGSGEAGGLRWLGRLRELDEGIIKKLREYRTIEDLLAMNQGGKAQKAEKRAQSSTRDTERGRGPR